MQLTKKDVARFFVKEKSSPCQCEVIMTVDVPIYIDNYLEITVLRKQRIEHQSYIGIVNEIIRV